MDPVQQQLLELLSQKDAEIARLQQQVETRNQIIAALGGVIPDDDSTYEWPNAVQFDPNIQGQQSSDAPPPPPPTDDAPLLTDGLDPNWYFGAINRVDAENILASCGRDALLVRTSSIPGCFALSKYQHLTGQFAHLLITTVANGFFIENSADLQVHGTLADLISNSPECFGFIPAGFSQKKPQQAELDRLTEALSHIEEDPEEAKRERLRDKVIDEIIQTEKDYSADLGLVVKHYMVPLSKKESKLATKEEVQSLFSNITEILDINYSVLNTFEQRKRKKEGGGRYVIGDVFLKMADDFKVYTVYCINHPSSVSTIEKLRKSNASFADFEKKINAMPETKGIGLIGYLIKPVQRITKYPLLLRELIKYTPENHPEFANLSAAQDKINQVVDYINERKRIFENDKKLNEIKNCLEELGTLDLVKSNRTFAHEATVQRWYKQNDTHEYRLYIFNDMLLFAKMRTKDKYRFKGKIYLDMIRIVDVIDNADQQNAVEFLDRNINEKEFTLTALFASDKEKKTFLNEIRKAQKEYYITNQDKLQAEARARRYLQEFKFTEPDPIKIMKEKLEKEKELKKKGAEGTPPALKKNTQEDIKAVVLKLVGTERQKSVATYDNFAAGKEDLEFSKGDVVWILARHDSGIWKGECNGMTGVFPAKSVEEVAERPGPNPQNKSAAQNLAVQALRKQPSLVKSNSTGSLNASPSTSPQSPPPTLETPPMNPAPSSSPSKTPLNLPGVRPSSKTANPPIPIQNKAPVKSSTPVGSPTKNSSPAPVKNSTTPAPSSPTVPAKSATNSANPTPTKKPIIPFDVLKDPNTRPKDCDINILEKYLSEQDFVAALKMSPAEFDGLPIWKKNQLKKAIGLF